MSEWLYATPMWHVALAGDDEALALSALGHAASIRAPAPGMGLRLKPIKMDAAARHYFRPDQPTQEMSIFGSPFALLRGIAVIAAVGLTGCYLDSFIVAPSLLLACYIAAFHIWRCWPKLPLGDDHRPLTQQRVCIIGAGLSGLVSIVLSDLPSNVLSPVPLDRVSLFLPAR